jgi:hypothetical protein
MRSIVQSCSFQHSRVSLLPKGSLRQEAKHRRRSPRQDFEARLFLHPLGEKSIAKQKAMWRTRANSAEVNDNQILSGNSAAF